MVKHKYTQNPIEHMKQTKTITINDNLLEWIEEMIEKKEFASVSHAVGKALLKLKQEYESGKGR
jgi:Arc/MetJ-type ribon-helix-helix transcriptional regulator